MAIDPEAFDEGGTLARLIELSGELLCVFDAEGVVRAAIGSLVVLTDPVSGLIGQSLLERIHPDEVLAVRARLAHLRATGAVYRFEARCRCDDGEYRWFAFSVTLTASSSHAAVVRDLTERKWVERELEASLSLVEATLESTGDGLLVADSGGHIVSFNRRFLEMWGITDSVVFAGSREIDRAFEPMLREAPEHLSLSRELIEAREVDRNEVLSLHDGRVFERYARPRQIGNVFEGRVFSFRDVSERVRAEQGLREHLSMGIEHAVEGIARIDERGRYRSVNAAFAKILGYEESEILALDLGSMSHPDDRPRVRTARDTMGPDGKVELDVRALRKDGTIAVLRTLIVRAQGRDPGFHVFVRDITEQKEMEQRLALSDRMASIGTLAAGVAHEINNPLAFVVANAAILADTLPKLASSLEPAQLIELTEIVGALREGAERVRRIVRDLKIFSRPEETTNGPVDLRSVIESTVHIAWNEIEPRARLVKHLEVAAIVEGNEGQLGQVILNLLINAAHAIPEGHASENEIRISISKERDGRIALEIHDTGAGIPAAILPRIFDPFFTTKAVGEGTGLGLAVCHGIVAKLGGEIAVVSNVGVGTTFRVLLRAATGRAKSARPPALPIEPAAYHDRILIVDDEAMISTALRRLLQRQHYDVTVCGGGREALAVLAAQPDFQVILCDMMMPGVTGMDVYEELVRTSPEVARRMVFMTGGIFTPRARAFLDSVPNHRVEKPIEFPRFLAWMRATLHPAVG